MTTRTVFFRFRPTFAHAIRPKDAGFFAVFAFFLQIAGQGLLYFA